MIGQGLVDASNRANIGLSSWGSLLLPTKCRFRPVRMILASIWDEHFRQVPGRVSILNSRPRMLKVNQNRDDRVHTDTQKKQIRDI
jgi:hypothetical protein